MAVNPYKSPLLVNDPFKSPLLEGIAKARQKQRNKEIVKKHYVLLNIVRNFTNWYDFKDLDDTYGYIEINNEFYITSTTKKGTKMRMISRLDWVHYNPKDLALAIETDTVEAYYAQQLNDPASDPNVWADAVKEFELKTYYANRVGRSLDSLDNL